ncbi:cysteine protease StiP domain-containing protein [Burkholderia lata]|uniref:Cysteine protease StiP n=1 Tax=Burkholderia lata (strain ATCC 17760 / DSM 23089 / LMG 22485 / NCIMB 9086 / R18194 / 383) TaxID=482957 RepID=A0A6P2VNL9_BURL3|nr:cysteine protease StiP domain-containing protein [Burkholderia lata]VWC92640.1 Cysteine protease StiP [Burkholderia lata]
MGNRLANLNTVGSGSYAPDDVHFLLRHVRMSVTDVEEKERLIQTNQKHYSDMIGLELAPTDVHKRLYARALVQNGARMASDVQSLAMALSAACTGPDIALVSFVRAGLPLGVLLRRALVEMGRDARHYGISIIRDRGIDTVALEAIVGLHGAENIVFVDGWTGKGAISSELARTLADDTRFPEGPRLVVLADPCGRAWLAASANDWTIPSGILGATVSGLVSRTIWPAQGGLHGCVVYDHLREHDVTREFIDRIDAERRALADARPAVPWTNAQRQTLQASADDVVSALATRFDIGNLNRVKPGIAEATRAVLRRVPDRVLVRDRNDSDVQLLLHLTERAGVTVEEAGAALGPYRAATIIRNAN